MIKNLKSFLYRREDVTNEEYDKTKTFKEIKVSEYTLEGRKELFETTILNNTRELASKKSTGRKTGSATLTMNLSKSILASHSQLVESGLGQLTVASSPITVTLVATDTITVSSTSYVSGDIIQITADGVQYNNLLVESADASSVTLRSPLTALEVTMINAATTKTVKKVSKCAIGRPLQGYTYTLVAVFEDDSIEVLRGAGVAASFDITTDGQAKITFTFNGAELEWKDQYGNEYLKPSGTITAETYNTPIYFNFKSSLLYDTVNEEDMSLFPQALMLKVAHTLQPNTLQGGLNNLVGYYTQPSVECEANFHYSNANRKIFSDTYENNTSQFYFCSQENFAFFAPRCQFVGANPADFNVYDSIQVMMNINDDADNEPLVVLPQ